MQLFILLCLLVTDITYIRGQCERSSSIKFNISSWKNETGHRIVAAQVQSDATDDGISLSVEHWTEICDGVETVFIRTEANSRKEKQHHPTNNTTTTAPTPTSDYEYLPGLGFYKFYTETVTWREGQELCEKDGAHMVLLDSQKEIDTVYNITGCCDWVGVFRNDFASPWMNVLNQTVNASSLVGWHSGFPNTNSWNCVVLAKRDDHPGIINNICWDKFKVICELPAQET